MVRIEKTKLMPGVYIRLSPKRDPYQINVNIGIRWWAWPLLMWKSAHKQFTFRWWQYPRVVLLIAGYTVKRLFKPFEVSSDQE